MKKITFIILLLIPSFFIFSQENKETTNVNPDSTFNMVEQMPGFPGGEQARILFLRDNIKYPQKALERGISGTVYVSFIVEKDGSLSDIKISRGIGGGCDEEVIRVVKLMPKWIPGKQKGKAVRVLFHMPVKFLLEDTRKKEENKEPQSQDDDLIIEIDNPEPVEFMDSQNDFGWELTEEIYEPIEAEPVNEIENGEEPVFQIVEESPVFPGGEDARIKFIADNIKYPESAKESGITGTVYVSFIVEKDGSLSEIKILRGIGGGCDEEVIRVVKLMPKWIPGKHRGKPVRVQYNMPLKFYLP